MMVMVPLYTVMDFNDSNDPFFKTSFINHSFKKLKNPKPLRRSFVVKKIDEYNSTKKPNP